MEGKLINPGRILAALALCSMMCRAGIAQNPVKAPFDVATAEAKASQGDITAMVKLGEAYWGKQGIPADIDKGRMWLDRAADAGSLEARMFLGMSYTSGVGLPKDPTLAFKYLLQAAQQQNVDPDLKGSQALAQYFIARFYEQGIGVEKSHEMAIQFLKMAADNGNYPAQFDLGSLYNDGKGNLPMDKAKACQLFQEAADQGFCKSNAQRRLLLPGWCRSRKGFR